VAKNPLVGNAIYVVTGLESWQSLLKLSKEVLNRLYANRVRKIVHRGNWKGRLEESLLSSTISSRYTAVLKDIGFCGIAFWGV